MPLLLAGVAFAFNNLHGEDFELKGDIRARNQTLLNRYNGAPDMTTFQMRMRLAPFIKINDNVTLSGRACYEGSTTPNIDSRLKDNQELSFDRVNILLKNNSGSLTLGETDNPFALNIPQIDKDIPILGAFGQLPINKSLKMDFLFDAGRLITQDTKTKSTGLQINLQEQYEKFSFSGNVGFQHFYDFDNNFRYSNSKHAQFDILSSGFSLSTGNGKRFPVKIFGEFLYNFSMPEQNKAFMAGINVGDSSKPRGLFASFNYRWIERDSLVAGLSARDSPLSNMDNFIFSAEYRLNKNLLAYAINGNPKHIVKTGLKDTQRLKYIETGLRINF
jgi:hypothetical protein